MKVLDKIRTPAIYLGLYYGVSICLVSFASAMAVVTLNIHHRGVRGIEVPTVVKKLVLGLLSKLVHVKFGEDFEDSTARVQRAKTVRRTLRRMRREDSMASPTQMVDVFQLPSVANAANNGGNVQMDVDNVDNVSRCIYYLLACNIYR